MVKSKNENFEVLYTSAKSSKIAHTKLSVLMPPPQAGPDNSETSDKFSRIFQAKAHPQYFLRQLHLWLQIFLTDVLMRKQENTSKLINASL